MNCVNLFQKLAIASLAVLAAASQDALQTRHLTLSEAVHVALAQNPALKIARLRVIENEQKKAGDRSAYFPTITNQSNALHVTDLQSVGIPAGAFGAAAGSLVPAHNISLPQGQKTLLSSGTTIAQPLTQLIRIRQANRIGSAEVAVSRAELKKAENQIALQVHSLYFGVLIARLQKQAAERDSTYAEQRFRESQEDVRNGSALRVAEIQGRAGLLEAQQSVLTAELELSDLTTELNDVLGVPLDTRLELDPAVPANVDERPRDEYVKLAWSENPEILAAEEVVRKARAGVIAAKTAYIPDVTAYARQSYQNGVPFLVRNFGTFGVNLEWDVFDFGKRRSAIRERDAQLAQAEENLWRIKEEVAVVIERSYNKVERTRKMAEVADQVVKLRRESERLAQNQLGQGVILVSEQNQTTAAAYKADAKFLQATLGYLLARAELERAAGRSPGN